MSNIKRFNNYSIDGSLIKGGVEVDCKDTNGNTLGTINYDCGSGVKRIKACQNAGFTNTAQTSGLACE